MDAGHTGQPDADGGMHGAWGVAFQKVFLDGDDLYWRPGKKHNTSYTYPPPFAAVSVWMLALPYRAVRLIWFGLMLSCSLVAVWIAWRYARERAPPSRYGALILALSVLLVARFWLNDLAHGQSNWLITLLLFLGLAAAELSAKLGAIVTGTDGGCNRICELFHARLLQSPEAITV